MIGVMQGRLVPPENGRFQSHPEHWRDEFSLAKKAGMDYIEWIVDSQPNPIFSRRGRGEISYRKCASKISIPAICADWFMENPIWINELQATIRLTALLYFASEIGARRIILPFVDNSRIKDEKDKDLVLGFLARMQHLLGKANIELHLEMDLPPLEFRDFLRRIVSPWIWANWDSGNSSGLGYVASEEFAAYGDRIGSIHIKDRTREKKTMPLGQGDADFEDVFKSIKSVGYTGDLTLQVARGEDGGEVDWIREQANFVRERLR